MDLKVVSENYMHKDSAGIICLPVRRDSGSALIRKLVLVKEGYVFTEYYLKNQITDTSLKAIKLAKNVMKNYQDK